MKIIDRNKPLQRDLFSYPDKNPFDCINELRVVLGDAIRNKTPFSMIRLGDGEGRILGFPTEFSQEVYLNQVLTYQFGPKVINRLQELHGQSYLDNSMDELKRFICDAISNADVLGAPSWLHFRSDITNDNITPLAAQSVCLEYIKKLSRTDKVFDHFIFKPFHKNGLFDELLSDVNSINIISHTDISEKVKERFSLIDCKHIKIPGHQTFMKDEVFHYPDEYKKIISNLKDVKSGDIYFVAAGYLGKHYCNEIKKNGGIAIDIGSIFDSWCGIGRTDALKNQEFRI